MCISLECCFVIHNVLGVKKNIVMDYKKNNYRIVNYASYKFWDIDYSQILKKTFKERK